MCSVIKQPSGVAHCEHGQAELYVHLKDFEMQNIKSKQKSFLSCRDIYVQQVGSPQCLLISIKMGLTLERSENFTLTLLETLEVWGRMRICEREEREKEERAES